MNLFFLDAAIPLAIYGWFKVCRIEKYYVREEGRKV